MNFLRQEKLNFIPSGFQENIKNKKLLIIGCGGVGSVLSSLLVRGGFLNLKLVDFDRVDLVNIQRQFFFSEDVGQFKVDALKKNLLRINSSLEIEILKKRVNCENFAKICFDCDIIIDATDNFETRFLIDKFCFENDLVWLYNGAIKTEVVSCFFLGKKSKFSKIFKNAKDVRCSNVGILTSTTYLSASLAYNMIVKFFLNDFDDKLIKVDLFKNKFFKLDV